MPKDAREPAVSPWLLSIGALGEAAAESSGPVILVMEADVVVIGSGAAGLSAAIAAATTGARVVLLEREKLVGGMTSFSGGGLWIPNNRFMREEGIADSVAEAATYAKRLANHPEAEPLIDRYLEECNQVLDFLEAETNIRFEGAVGHPDYRTELIGSRDHGRGVANLLFDTKRLGEFKSALRRGSVGSGMTSNEFYVARHGSTVKFDLPELWQTRANAGMVGMGMGLVGFLLEGCLDRDVAVLVGHRAVELVREGEKIGGVVVEHEGSRETIRVRRGVVLASGGFEWNSELVSRFLGVPMTAPAGPGHNVGDGLVMAMKAGAAIGSMTEAWWNMMYRIPGDLYEGNQMHRPTSDIRGLPGMLCVNRQGRRFVNEAMNYHDLGKSMFAFDPGRYEYPNTPAFMLFDAEFRATYPFARTAPTDPDPAWLIKGETLSELAEVAGIDPPGLESQVHEFNKHAAHLEDPAFHRGATAYDNHMGDVSKIGPAANLRPLGSGPYYAVHTYLGCFGTKGGPLINANAEVLDHAGHPIRGLTAAGNVAAHVFGSAYPGPGATLGPAVVFGVLAGRASANR